MQNRFGTGTGGGTGGRAVPAAPSPPRSGLSRYRVPP